MLRGLSSSFFVLALAAGGVAVFYQRNMELREQDDSVGLSTWHLRTRTSVDVYIRSQPRYMIAINFYST